MQATAKLFFEKQQVEQTLGRFRLLCRLLILWSMYKQIHVRRNKHVLLDLQDQTSTGTETGRITITNIREPFRATTFVQCLTDFRSKCCRGKKWTRLCSQNFRIQWTFCKINLINLHRRITFGRFKRRLRLEENLQNRAGRAKQIGTNMVWGWKGRQFWAIRMIPWSSQVLNSHKLVPKQAPSDLLAGLDDDDGSFWDVWERHTVEVSRLRWIPLQLTNWKMLQVFIYKILQEYTDV